MKVLVLGGGQFVGRHCVDALLAGGHDVTLLNRGQTNQELFAELPKVVADRNQEIQDLRSHGFDAVVDCSGYRPGQIDRIAKAVGREPYYMFVSTISVYSDQSLPRLDEDSPVFDPSFITDPDGCPIDGETYGALKVMCEDRVRASFDKFGIIRPGIVIGPYDHTQRVSYWPWRLQFGGKVAVPDRLSQPFQGIDGRDLAALAVKFVESQIEDTVNGVGPSSAATLEDLLNAARTVAKSDCEFISLSAEQQEVANPRWPVVLSSDGSHDGIFSVDHSKAKKYGLNNRSLLESCQDILNDIGSLDSLKAGWSREEERAYLDSLLG